MEIAPGQFHVPLWGKDGKLLVQDESVIVEPLGDTERVSRKCAAPELALGKLMIGVRSKV